MIYSLMSNMTPQSLCQKLKKKTILYISEAMKSYFVPQCDVWLMRAMHPAVTASDISHWPGLLCVYWLSAVPGVPGRLGSAVLFWSSGSDRQAATGLHLFVHEVGSVAMTDDSSQKWESWPLQIPL